MQKSGKDSLNQCSQEQADIVKKAVRETFHEMKRVEDKLADFQQIRSALKRDLIDLKEGRLDRIEHRQNIDIVSKEHSVFIVHAKTEIGSKNVNQWYIPYNILFREDKEPPSDITINNSIAKIHAGGSFQLDDGEIKYL